MQHLPMVNKLIIPIPYHLSSSSQSLPEVARRAGMAEFESEILRPGEAFEYARASKPFSWYKPFPLESL